jgi:diadenylate cyclase
MGLLILAVIFNIAKVLELHTINWVLTKLFAVGVVAFLIIFQPELRRALARMGENTIFGSFLKKGGTIDEVVQTAERLSRSKIGALIAIEREVGLKNYIEGGLAVDAKVSAELLTSIFFPNTPTHDGGVIIQGDRIASCGCLFPLSQNPQLSPSMGTRHRAALGLSEETDVVCVVVSEETGGISVAVYGKLTRDLDEEGLRRVLTSLFRPPSEGPRHWTDFWPKEWRRSPF